MAAAPPESESLAGAVLAGKYSLVRPLGRGGMGAVYEAEHLGIGRRVAVKVLDAELAKDRTLAGRFAREARAASAIESAHVVQVLDAGKDGARAFLVMELLRGESLGARLHRGPMTVLDAVHVAAQIARGLAHAHAAGVVHRDLKPDNVLLVAHGADPSFVKIVDFGISKVDGRAGGTTPLGLTARGAVLGTPLYMAPEQVQAFSDVDGRADVYSAGAILFECLTGRTPHVATTCERLLLAACTTDAPDVRAIVPEVPDAIAAIVARALARDRAQRFATAAEMLRALQVAAPHERAATDATLLVDAGDVSPTAVTMAAIAPYPRRFLPVLAVAGLLAGIAVGAAGMVARRASDRPAPPTSLAATTAIAPPVTPPPPDTSPRRPPADAASASPLPSPSFASSTSRFASASSPSTSSFSSSSHSSALPLARPPAHRASSLPALPSATAHPRAAAPPAGDLDIQRDLP